MIPYALATKIQYLIGRPIGISFINGQGTSGVLCSAHDGQLYVYEYLYQAQFAMKHYDFRHIQDIHAFRIAHIKILYTKKGTAYSRSFFSILISHYKSFALLHQSKSSLSNLNELYLLKYLSYSWPEKSTTGYPAFSTCSLTFYNTLHGAL